MPTYSYECKKCTHSFEVFHTMTAKPHVKCPECKGACKRLLGAGSGIIFKGSGFYETDYKEKKGTAPSKETKKSESKSETKAEANTASSDKKGPDSKTKKDSK